MRYFREVDMAKVCYASEAVAWIVQGIVPNFVSDDQGAEVRGSLSAFFDDRTIEPDPLTPREFAHFAVNMTYDDYLSAAYDWGVPTLPEEYHRMGGEALDFEEWFEKWKADELAREEESRAKLRDALYRFEHEVDRAKAEVMASLVQGRIQLSGLWFESEDALSEVTYEDAPEAERIPAALISPKLFDWDKNILRTRPSDGRPAGAFYLVTMETDAMLSTFKGPIGTTQPARIMFGTALVEDELETPQIPTSTSKRGRPPRHDWLREGMRAWYSAQCARGRLGRGKVEADLAAAQEWAESAGSPVGRTTVQNYLGGLLRPRS